MNTFLIEAATHFKQKLLDGLTSRGRGEESLKIQVEYMGSFTENREQYGSVHHILYFCSNDIWIHSVKNIVDIYNQIANEITYEINSKFHAKDIVYETATEIIVVIKKNGNS